MSMLSPTSKHVELTVENESVGVRYLTAGEGDPIVLLHGIGLDAATVSWRHTLPVLAEDHEVYALDFPGHGESEKPNRRYTTDYYQDVLAAFLDDLDIDSPTLVGISMGGAVALGHALDDEVDRLVLVNSHGLGSDAPWRFPASVALWTPGFDSFWWAGATGSRFSVRESLRQFTSNAEAEFVDDVYQATQDPAVGEALTSWQRSEFLLGGLKTNYVGELDEVSVPTLLVHGKDDPLFPVSWSVRAAEKISDSDLHVFENCGHWPPREQPRAFNGVVQSFLNGQSRPLGACRGGRRLRRRRWCPRRR
ncbi:alpha/beta fold hydrolase [Haladaptatus sp. GCM10025707]|uniref:alpha/beta fold hydrolase n=2 Tax=Haladaptatus TaxID=367188 RepID=UPI00360DF13B